MKRYRLTRNASAREAALLKLVMTVTVKLFTFTETVSRNPLQLFFGQTVFPQPLPVLNAAYDLNMNRPKDQNQTQRVWTGLKLHTETCLARSILTRRSL